MSKLIIFAPKCGGNHLANMVGASQNLDNCLNFQKLNLKYHNDNNFRNTHMNDLFLKNQNKINHNSIYTGHLDEVWNNYHFIKNKIKDVLIIDLINKGCINFRSHEISYLESCAYTKPFIKKLFPDWYIESINLDDMLCSGDVLKFVLDSTKFNISAQYKKLHDMWIDKIKDTI